MRLSLLQPHIVRGDIEHNLQVIQSLIARSRGDLLVLPEYALTGSLVLDKGADIRNWATQCAQAKDRVKIQTGQILLINTLIEQNGRLYNCCEFLPGGERYFKLFPDDTELSAGIQPGGEQKVFERSGKRFKVLICYDLPHITSISTDHLDFLLFIYHLTEENLARVMGEIKVISRERSLPVLVSSLVSDKNNGFRSFICRDTVISLANQEGILEVNL